MSAGLWWVFVGLVMGLCATGVFAHGGGPIQIANEPLCNDFVSVWLSPSPPRANDTIHFTVGLSDETSAPVLDRVVIVEIVGDSGVVASGLATTEQSVNRLFYEADFDAVRSGSYSVAVRVPCADREDSASFAMTVESASPLVGWSTYLVGSFILLAIVLLWRQWKSSGAEGNRPARPFRPK